MLEFIIKSGLKNGFDVVDVFRKKKERKIFEYLVDFNAYHQVFEDGYFVRAFWSNGDPVGFYLSNPDKRDIKGSFIFSASKVFPQNISNFSKLLPHKINVVNPDIYDSTFYSIEESEFLEIIARINDAVLMFPRLRIIKVVFEKLLDKSYIMNSFGLNAKYKKTTFRLNLTLMYDDNLIDINETSPFYNNIHPFRLVSRAYNILNSFSERENNKNYEYFVLSPEAVITILKVFSEKFKGELNFNNDKFLASTKLNIVDNPLLNRGTGSVCFDDEGVQSNENYLIRKGIFQSTINNIESGFKLNKDSTGNGFRRKNVVFPDVKFTNLYIKEGLYSIKNILNDLGYGIIVSTLKLREKKGDSHLFSGYAYDFVGNEMRDNWKVELDIDFFGFFKNIVQISKEIKFFYSDFNIGSPYLVLRRN